MTVAPDSDDLPPAALRHLAAGRAECVWNPYDTTTWRIDLRSGAVRYLKAGFMGAYPSLAGERDRLLWLRASGVPVPEIVDFGSDEGVEWLVTVALGGASATDERHLADPRATVRTLAEGLRAVHAIDPADCPFDHRVQPTLDHIRERVERDDIDPAGWHEDHRHHTVYTALAELEDDAPTVEDVVVTHGDYCFPNVMIAGGRAVGFLDVGEAGLGDRWRDLAVATWSVSWNVGTGLEGLFLEAYGAPLDRERLAYYRLLYDLES